MFDKTDMEWMDTERYINRANDPTIYTIKESDQMFYVLTFTTNATLPQDFVFDKFLKPNIQTNTKTINGDGSPNFTIEIVYPDYSCDDKKYENIIEQIDNFVVAGSSGKIYRMCIDLTNNSVSGDPFGKKQAYFFYR